MVSKKKLKALNLYASLAVAEADVKEGRTRPARDFLKELKARYETPRKH